MSYCKTKRKIVDKIHEELKPLSITQLEDVLSLVKDKQPITLEEYIKEHIPHESYGCYDMFEKPDVLRAFEHEVRAICLDLGPNFEKVEASEYIDHFCEMYVQGHSLDIWIHENGSLFNPSELAHVIYLLYSGEVIFR